MKYLIRPLTKRMFSQLKVARQIELGGIKRRYCIPEDFNRSLARLYKRGLVGYKDCEIEGKRLVCIYITQAGINLLDRFEEHSKLISIDHLHNKRSHQYLSFN